MAYKALYRTYRPLTFLEVAGQRHIVKTLQNALKTSKVAHAYLFTGPRGTGKTSMAKLMAKALNCEKGLGQQCNACPICLAINDGSHPDVIEIDAASNNGVDEVRDLIDKVKYAPIKGKYKIYIVDEVHMMTSGAFNALLKTLEEPPAHVVFILATTEPHKVLPTIVSRCQRYDFAKVSDRDIKARMVEILETEQIEYEPRAIDAIITLADGGVRDALSLLDQVIAYSGQHVKEADILELFGLAGTGEKINLLKAVATGDAKTVLETLEGFTRQGVDIKRLVADLLDILKDLLIYMRTSGGTLLTTLTSLEADDLLETINYEMVPQYLDALLKAQQDFRYVANIRSLFEIVLLKLSHADVLPVIDPMPEAKKAIETPKPEAKPESVKQMVIEPPMAKEATIETEPDDDIDFAPVNGNGGPSINHVPKVALVESSATKDEERPTIFEAFAAQEQAETKPLVIEGIEDAKLESNGDKIAIDDENVIKVMVSGLKEDKIALLNRWSELAQLSADLSIGRFAALLFDGKPYVLSKQILILEYDLPNLVDKINVSANQPVLQKIVKALLSRNVLVYGMTRNECLRLKKKYLELNQIRKLPDRKNLSIDVKGYDL
jgi:DNA polymerase-3 subunit gamma/tau